MTTTSSNTASSTVSSYQYDPVTLVPPQVRAAANRTDRMIDPYDPASTAFAQVRVAASVMSLMPVGISVDKGASG